MLPHTRRRPHWTAATIAKWAHAARPHAHMPGTATLLPPAHTKPCPLCNAAHSPHTTHTTHSPGSHCCTATHPLNLSTSQALPFDPEALPNPVLFCTTRFSARFREYKYFIVDSGGDLDLGRMQAAANLFVGAHDYRNFCKLDVLAVKSFDRRIESFQIQPLGIQAATPHPRTSPTPPQPPAEEAVANALAARREGGGNGCGGSRAGVSRVYAMTIRGSAFLWHQVCVCACVCICLWAQQVMRCA